MVIFLLLKSPLFFFFFFSMLATGLGVLSFLTKIYFPLFHFLQKDAYFVTKSRAEMEMKTGDFHNTQIIITVSLMIAWTSN